MVNGFALAASRSAQGMPSVVNGAKIALLDFSLQRHKLQLGVQVHESYNVRSLVYSFIPLRLGWKGKSHGGQLSPVGMTWYRLDAWT